jgi:hypothetical protein
LAGVRGRQRGRVSDLDAVGRLAVVFLLLLAGNLALVELAQDLVVELKRGKKNESTVYNF